MSVLAAPAAAQQTRFTRPIEVPRAGWVEVPLDPEILRRAAPAGGHLRLFGPAGEEVAFARWVSGADGERLSAEVISAVQAGAGWLVTFEVRPPGGAVPGHDRLVLTPPEGAAGHTPEGEAPAPARLEGSDDAESWTLLTVGRPEAGAGGDLVLSYPASRNRYLRLRWSTGFQQATGLSGGGTDGGDASPEGGSTPSASPGASPEAAQAPAGWSAVVEAVPRRCLGVTLGRPACQSPTSTARPSAGEPSPQRGAPDGGRSSGPTIGAPADSRGGLVAGPRLVCPLPLGTGARLLRRLDLTVEARQPVGYRLLEADGGSWEVVAEGVWSSPVPETPHALGLDLAGGGVGREDGPPVTAEPLRLEVYGSGAEIPALTRVAAELRAQSLVFEAVRAGRYTLAYGTGIYRSSRSADVRPSADVEPLSIEPGAEEAGAAVATEPSLPTGGDPAPSVRFARRWPMTAEAPEAGGLHRLEVTPEVYGVARRDLGDLRLLAGSAQVPYARWRPDTPSPVETVGGAVPLALTGTGFGSARGGEAGSLGVAVDLELPDLPYSTLVVHAAPRRFRGRLRLLAAGGPAADGAGDAGPAGEVRTRPVTPWLDWECDPRPPLSCRRVLDVAGLAGIGSGAEAGGDRSGRLILELDPTAREAGPAGAPGAVDLELFRHRDVLLFPWPAEGREVRLVAGAAELEAPEYDLGERVAELLARPSSRAELGPEGEEVDVDGRVGGWTMVVSLLVGLGLLFWLLNGILAAREPV